jgi:hypothetical protein
MNEVTRILSVVEQGDRHAAEQLLPLVYDELRQLATQKLAQEAPGQTLQPTALVHEAYLRLVAKGEQESSASRNWDHRGHFFAAAAEAMRRILIDNARRKRRPKHGGDRHRVSGLGLRPGLAPPRAGSRPLTRRAAPGRICRDFGKSLSGFAPGFRTDYWQGLLATKRTCGWWEWGSHTGRAGANSSPLPRRSCGESSWTSPAAGPLSLSGSPP